MEHRCGERLSTNLTAVLRTSAGEALQVTVRNLGCGGAFVSLPANRKIPRGMVELELRLPHANRRIHRWKAFLVHRQEKGAGLMFNELQLGQLKPFLAAEKALRRVRRAIRSPQAEAGPSVPA